MQNVVESSDITERAVIENIGIVKTDEVYRGHNRYAIVCDWCLDALDIFDTLDKAKQFIAGFKKQTTNNITNSYHRGRVLRRCVDSDMKEFDHIYFKKIDIQEVYKEILVD